MEIDYELELGDENGAFGCGNLEHCCGVQEIGGFGEADEALEQLLEQYDNALENAKVFDESTRELRLPKGFKKPPEPTMQTVIAELKAMIAAEVQGSSQACIATTVNG